MIRDGLDVHALVRAELKLCIADSVGDLQAERYLRIAFCTSSSVLYGGVSSADIEIMHMITRKKNINFVANINLLCHF